MNKIFTTIWLALVAAVAGAQNYNNFILATNIVPVQYTNTVVSSNLYCISRTGTLWVTIQPVTNNPAVTAGTGSFAVALGGLQYAAEGNYTNVNQWGTAASIYQNTNVYYFPPAILIATNLLTTINNVLTIPYNGTNPVTGYLVFDASPFGSMVLMNMQNQSTNLIATNITANITWR